AAPGTSGPPPPGTTLKVLDEEDQSEKPPGETGEVFVGNSMLFEGYTSGENEEMVDGHMSTGDLGYVDEEGRLFIEGRADNMIVSGGENVYPEEVEEALAQHKGVKDVAVIGVEDKVRRAAQGLRGEERQRQPEGAQGPREEEPGRLQGPARGGVREGAAAQAAGQGRQAGLKGRERIARSLTRGST
ncbi:MAG TPA: AMP-binding protein, partial [Thermoleophilaceae bacterium]